MQFGLDTTMLAKKDLLKLAVSAALLASATACSSATEAVDVAPAPVAHNGYDYSSGSCDPVAYRVGGCNRGASLQATGYQGNTPLQHSDAVWGECLSMVKHAPYWMGMGAEVSGTSVPNKANYDIKTVKRAPRAASAAETAAYYKKKGWSTEPVVIKREQETRQGETVVIETKIEGHAGYTGGPSKPALVPAPSSNVYGSSRGNTHSNGHTSGHRQNTYSQPTYNGGAQPNVVNPRSARRDIPQNTSYSAPRTSAPAMAPKSTRIQPPSTSRISRPAIAPPALIKPPMAKSGTIQAPAIQAPTIKAPAIQAPTITPPAIKAPAIQAPTVTAPKVAAPAPKIRKPLKLKLRAK